jgi:HD-like signal output (HDOD) protein
MQTATTENYGRDLLIGPDPTWEALAEQTRFQWLAEIQNFPAPPLILELLGGGLTLEQYDPQRLAEQLVSDSVLTGRIISRANSAAFGLRQPVTTLSRALVQLGFNTVRNLITRYQIEMSALRLPGIVREHIVALQRSAELGATIAFHWSRALKLPDPGTVATRCLLGRLGAFLLARRYVQQMPAYLEAGHEPQRLQFEASQFGITTRSLTYRVARLWGFPDELQVGLFHLWTPLFSDTADVERCVACAGLSLSFDPPQHLDDIGKWLSLRVHQRLRHNLELCGALASLPQVVDSDSYRREMAVLSEDD